jgi:hypothetical protein
LLKVATFAKRLVRSVCRVLVVDAKVVMLVLMDAATDETFPALVAGVSSAAKRLVSPGALKLAVSPCQEFLASVMAVLKSEPCVFRFPA